MGVVSLASFSVARNFSAFSLLWQILRLMAAANPQILSIPWNFVTTLFETTRLMSTPSSDAEATAFSLKQAIISKHKP